MKVTNNSKALQGINTKSGRVFIRPGQSKDVEFNDTGLKQARRLSFLTVGQPKGGKSGNDGGSGNGGGSTGPEAKHRGAGSYSIMDGETEVREKLTKEQADAFNALDSEGKTKWLADNLKPAA